jgi:hypothetical protein
MPEDKAVHNSDGHAHPELATESDYSPPRGNPFPSSELVPLPVV